MIRLGRQGAAAQLMDTVRSLVDLFLHLDRHLHQLVTAHDETAYLVLFAVIFAETGLVVTPFLPGDSLLFVAGALAAAGLFDFGWLVGLLLVAAVAGDTVNYWLGSLAGPRVFRTESRFLNQRHLDRTRVFYERHGAMAVVIGRFMPIIRTFVPFVAGIAGMSYGRFVISNVAGGILWVTVCSTCGYLWGNLPLVKENFALVIIGVIVLSMAPGAAQWVWSRWRPRLDPAS
jgi:membrane-associated protein